MSHKRRMAAVVLALICLLPMISHRALAGDTSLNIPILMYHHIDENPINTMMVTPERFREDMVFLAENGFTPLLPQDVLAIARGERDMPPRPVMITFDDGYESNYIYMYPILRETGMKATVALIAMLVRTESGGAAWAMSWDQCREMYQSGLVDFASHTWYLHNHDNNLNYLKDGINGIQRLKGEAQADYGRRVGEDLAMSIAAIETQTGATVRMFAYPFGSTDSWMLPLLTAHWVTLAVTTGPGTADLGGNLLTLPRYRVDMGKPLSQVAYLQGYLSVPLPPVMDEPPAAERESSPVIQAIETCRGYINRALRALGDIILADLEG